MIQFRLHEIIELVPAFHGTLARAKRTSPPGKWRPWLKLSYTTEQEDETDKWVAWIKWDLMGGTGVYPCRDTGKNEIISRMDPPDRHATERVAELLAKECMARMTAQYNKWIQSDFAAGEDLS